jgi:hypothetical protein
MNKLANTYLDAVASLMAIHFSHPGQEDWPLIVANLADAVRELNEDPVESELNALASGGSATTEDDPVPKSLTLSDLKRQVENAIAWQKEMPNIFLWGTPPPEGVLWLFGDFEIRRRK